MAIKAKLLHENKKRIKGKEDWEQGEWKGLEERQRYNNTTYLLRLST
jgi:hypothetical protein